MQNQDQKPGDEGGTLEKQQIYKLIEKFTHKRYSGRNSGREVQKYKEMASRLIKSEHVAMDVDLVELNQVQLVQDIVTDFTVLKTLNVHSTRLSPIVMDKFWLHLQKLQKLHANDQADFFSFLKANLYF